MTPEARARELVSRWEHGDETNRQWLRDKATPDIVAAFRAIRWKALRATWLVAKDGALDGGSPTADEVALCDHIADGIQALIDAPDGRTMKSDAALSGLAIGAVTEVLISGGRSMSDRAKRDTALSIAMGILHGCCGPNGDFSSQFRPASPQSEGD